MRLLPLVLVAALCACGAAPERVAAPAGERVSGHGLELTLPPGWYGDVTKLEPNHAPTLRAATFPLGRFEGIGHAEQERMGPDDLIVFVADYGPPARPHGTTQLPIRLGAENVVSFEGFRRPVATTSVEIAGTALQIWLVASGEPTASQLERANAVLATLRLERARWRTHTDEARGLSVEVPPGWAVAGESLTPALDEPREILSVGTGAFKPGGDRCAQVPERALEALRPGDALVTVLEHENARRLPARETARPFVPEAAACLDGPPDLELRAHSFAAAGRGFHVYVAFGGEATDARRDEAARLLASLRFEGAAGPVAFADPDVGVSGMHPPGWHRERGLTGFVEPREVLTLASYPLRRPAEAGECAPDTAREDLPADGVFVWLLEFRSGVPLDRFPDRPRPFRLDGAALDENVSCFAGPGRSWTFREGERRFQLLVSFGGAPTGARLREVEAVVNALELAAVPTPPPPPWAGWPLLPGSAPDSMRAPPTWTAAANRFRPDVELPPRALFFASNRPLPLLPRQRVEHARLPGHFPDLVLAHGFPDDAVLLWVLEESARRPLARHFPPIDRDWPGRDDFRPVTIATKPAPQVRWLVASGEWMGHRFSVWIARGPAASAEDLDLALTAARTVAVSGCDRGVGAPCVEPR